MYCPCLGCFLHEKNDWIPIAAEDDDGCHAEHPYLMELDFQDRSRSQSNTQSSESDTTWDSEDEISVTAAKVEHVHHSSVSRLASSQKQETKCKWDLEKPGSKQQVQELTLSLEKEASDSSHASLAVPEDTSGDASEDGTIPTVELPKGDEDPEIWEALSEKGMVREIQVTQEAEGQKTVCIYRLWLLHAADKFLSRPLSGDCDIRHRIKVYLFSSLVFKHCI